MTYSAVDRILKMTPVQDSHLLVIYSNSDQVPLGRDFIEVTKILNPPILKYGGYPEGPDPSFDPLKAEFSLAGGWYCTVCNLFKPRVWTFREGAEFRIPVPSSCSAFSGAPFKITTWS